MHTRIKRVRKAFSLTQTQFGERIGVKGNTITNYENSLRTPSDAVVMSICREFNVNETWLRTGEGDMFVKKTRAQEIDEFISDIMKGEPDFRQQLVSILARMSPEEWKMLERKAYELVDEMKKTSPAPKMTAEEEYEKSLGFAQSGESSVSNTTGGTRKNRGIKAG